MLPPETRSLDRLDFYPRFDAYPVLLLRAGVPDAERGEERGWTGPMIDADPVASVDRARAVLAEIVRAG